VGAFVVDGIMVVVLMLVLVGVPTVVGIVVGPGFGAENIFSLDHTSVVVAMAVGLFLWYVATAVVFMVSWGVKGQSPGMKFTAIEVRKVGDRSPLGMGRALLRFLLVPLFPGWLLAALTRKKQALHDLVAGSFVLK
jgi:uncharacterized RDD family membrane protein YckC